ncbi:GNAT family N-acetyltransferase [Clostridium sp. MB05]|jgi:diamine N-acetyltransferase|uniref:GNAT family N-acetyltransferase n=1 Tax=Clostridium sp. MB05 TaxID=3376682 RepID=UPI0039822871
MEINLRLLNKLDVNEYWEVGFENPDQEMFYYTGTTNYPTKEEIELFIEKSINNGERRHLLICDNDQILGEVVLMDIDDEYKSCSFRIAIFDKDNFSKGIGLKATKKALEIAFTELNLNRVELEVFDYNPRARAMYEKAGFKFEGTKREALFINNEFHDVHMMAILSKEFKHN